MITFIIFFFVYRTHPLHKMQFSWMRTMHFYFCCSTQNPRKNGKVFRALSNISSLKSRQRAYIVMIILSLVSVYDAMNAILKGYDGNEIDKNDMCLWCGRHFVWMLWIVTLFWVSNEVFMIKKRQRSCENIEIKILLWSRAWGPLAELWVHNGFMDILNGLFFKCIFMQNLIKFGVRLPMHLNFNDLSKSLGWTKQLRTFFLTKFYTS